MTKNKNYDKSNKILYSTEHRKDKYFSVIITFYGAFCDFDERCLGSLKKQTFSNFEIIFVQDGPSEHEDKLIKCFKESSLNTIYLANPANLGTLESRLRGFEHSCGEYIYFMDHDDAIADNFFHEMHQTSCLKNIDVIECGTITLPHSNRSTQVETRFKCGEERNGIDIIRRLSLNQSRIELWNKVFRRQVVKIATSKLRATLETANWCYGEDVIMEIEFMSFAKSYIGICTTNNYYYHHEKSISRSISSDKILNMLNCAARVGLYLNEKFTPSCSTELLKNFLWCVKYWLEQSHLSSRQIDVKNKRDSNIKAQMILLSAYYSKLIRQNLYTTYHANELYNLTALAKHMHSQ